MYDKNARAEDILENLKDTGAPPNNNKVSLKDAIIGRQYWKATWFCFVLVMVNQLTGQNAIMLYSNTIFQRMNKGGMTLSPKNGTILVGVVNFVGAIVSIYPVKTFRRKPLMVVGHAVVGVALFLVGIFEYYEMNIGVLIMTLFQLFVYQQSIGPLTWIYVAEVVNDSGLGFVMLSYKGALLIVSFCTEFMMDSGMHPWGVFWFYGGITTVGAIFHFMFMKETKELNDREKKTLY